MLWHSDKNISGFNLSFFVISEFDLKSAPRTSCIKAEIVRAVQIVLN